MAEYLDVTEEFLWDALQTYKAKYGIGIKIKDAMFPSNRLFRCIRLSRLRTWIETKVENERELILYKEY